jgi:signal transduction histidine kinase
MQNHLTETSPDARPDSSKLSALLGECLEPGILAFDAEGRLLLVNDRATRQCGLPTPAGHAPLPGPLRDLVHKALREGADFSGRQVLVPAGNGPARLLLVSAAMQRGTSGQVTGLTLVLNSLDAARPFELSLQRLDRMAGLGTLSAGMAHEIKNAMVAVKTFLDLLLQGKQDPQLAGIVQRELDRINGMVTRMLRFSSPSRDRYTNLRLHPLLEQSLGLIQPQLDTQKVTVDRTLAAAPDAVCGDSYQLEQVFLNLFFNALDAMGPHGRLRVATEAVPAGPDGLPDADAVRVTVQDSGVGIAPENLARLFEPFFTTKPEGTGLGLPITQRIIQEHRGVIRVDSRPGEGAAFHVLLPVAAAADLAP